MKSDEIQTQESIEELYDQMFEKLVIYARARVSEAQAEELAQETFAIACANPQKLYGSGNPHGWLLKTLKFLIKNRERKRASWCEMLMGDRDFDLILEDPALSCDLYLSYSDLVSEEEFRLIEAIDVHGYPIRQVAEHLNISVAACQKRLLRAEEKFRKNYKKHEKIQKDVRFWRCHDIKE